jgi:RNA polymerase sigma factor (sigma-70 family)
MDDHDGQGPDRLTARFEAERPRLRAVALRMLGSPGEADDAVQEAWLRLDRSGGAGIDNLAAWLTTVVSRVCLDVLRARRSRREEPLGAGAGGGHEPGPGADHGPGPGAVPVPEDEVVLAESVGLALLVVLETLSPAERVAFVLHDLFAVPFEDVAPIVGRTPVAAKKLASRARQRVRGTPAVPAPDLARRRRLVDAFLAASRRGDVGALVAVLDPDVVRRADPATLPAGAAAVLRGARAVAEETRTNVARARFAVPALVDGTIGLVVAPAGHLVAVLVLTVDDDAERITAIDVVADPARRAGLALAVVDPPTSPAPEPPGH